ncbi:unnamed protein product [Oppiella nova]|uniref:RING-type domain-containing protein n=1 Tax=Oppiella nova TaxID=334625 RepID=A0A7R9MIX9_9ACAR|nr:unnamed protein product [Oppiella nova]CAG2177811.1 unnamed protein product [Oppiella nova]
MPGYNIDRFVDMSESERDEMQCSICQDILRDPVVAPCCLQMFCEQCINEWLNTETTCPHDRKVLKIDSLTRPPRALVNMLMNLKIRCDFQESGCNEVLKLGELTQHTITCKFMDSICQLCHCEKLFKHNCVESLLDLINKMNKDNQDLKRKLELATNDNEPVAS